MKKVKWQQIVEDLLEGLFLSQHELAARCDVSQQSISNWKNGLRAPSNYAKKTLVKILGEEKIDLTEYMIEDEDLYFMKYYDRKDVHELLDNFERLSEISRKELLAVARAKD